MCNHVLDETQYRESGGVLVSHQDLQPTNVHFLVLLCGTEVSSLQILMGWSGRLGLLMGWSGDVLSVVCAVCGRVM